MYGEKRIAVENTAVDTGEKTKIEYRVWNPFRSKLAAAVLGGVDKIHMPPGTKVLYLGAASGTSVSHVSDIVGPVSYHYIFVVYYRSVMIYPITQKNFHHFILNLLGRNGICR